ncbi:hypothetical protein J7M00_00715 [bacterium]|nr:hypothetical protein [bacterium]
MRRLLIVIAAVTVLYGILWSFPRTSIGEMFTASWCGPCNTAHQYLLDHYDEWADSAAVLRFHTSDALEIYGAGARESYYGTYYEMGYVPHMFIDGEDYTYDYTSWIHAFSLHAAAESYIGIEEAHHSADSITIRVFMDEPGEEDDYRIMAVLTVNGLEAGGHSYHWVVQRIYTGATGNTFHLGYGDTVEFTYAFDLDPEWSPDSCIFVAYVIGPVLPYIQNGFKTILEPRPDYDFRVSADKKKGLCSPGGSANFNIQVANVGLETDYYNLTIVPVSMPSDWSAYMYSSDTSTTALVLSLSTTDIPLTVNAPSSGIGKFLVIAHSDEIPERCDTLSFMVGSGVDLLLVNDSDDRDSSMYFDYIEDIASLPFYWDTQNDGDIASFSTLGIDKVIWYCGNDTTVTLQGNERTELRNYILSMAGKVLINGSGIGRICGGDFTFYTMALGAQYQGAASSFETVSALEGLDPFSGWSASLSGAPRAEKVNPMASGATGIFQYPDCSSAGIVMEDYGARVIYLGFSMGELSTSSFNDLMDRCIQFLDEGFSGVVEKNIPDESILSVSPDPFNSSCKITIPKNADLNIYDIKGNIVYKKNQLSEQSLPSHNNKTTFIWTPDKTIPGGLYIVETTSKNMRKSKKIIYLK